MQWGAGGQSAATGTSPKLLSVVSHLADTGIVVRGITNERLGSREAVGALVLGIGFCSKGGMSIGTPVETMMMFTVLAFLAVHCRIERIAILMGEQMAVELHGRNATPHTRLLRANLERLVRMMCVLIPEIRINLISDADIFRSKAYVDAREELRVRAHPALLHPEFRYARTQFAVFHALQKLLGNEVIKLGWTLLEHDQSGSELLRGFRSGCVPARWCEAVFDSFAQVLGVDRLGYAYTAAAWSFDPRQRACPYVAASTQGRVLLGERQCLHAVIPEPGKIGRDSARKVAQALRFQHSWLEILAGLNRDFLPRFEPDLELDQQLKAEQAELNRIEAIHHRGSNEYANQARKLSDLLVKQSAQLRLSVISRLECVQEAF